MQIYLLGIYSSWLRDPSRFALEAAALLTIFFRRLSASGAERNEIRR